MKANLEKGLYTLKIYFFDSTFDVHRLIID